MTLRTLALATVSALALLGAAGAATAHRLAPSLFQVTEREDGRVDVVWKTPRIQPRGAALAPVLPARCTPDGEPRFEGDERAAILAWSADCGDARLVGARFGVSGLAASGTDALLRIVLRDGPPVRALLTSGREHFTVPPRQGALEVAWDYLELGFGHILGGPDHLFFVLGLVLLSPWWRRLVPVVTAFTVGHSVTLVLVTLGALRLAQEPVEVAIAASIVAVAVKLCREEASGHRDRLPLWAMAGGFGLLHGLGFAGALAEVGLPDAEIPVALLAFNVGIEIGQLAFVAVLLGLGGALRALALPPSPSWVRVSAYAIGSVAAFWCLERTALLL